MSEGFIKIERAIISVSNKEGLDQFVLGLKSWNIKIIASGGTALRLQEKGIEVVEVEDVTGFPELLKGRVKTLHPTIHAGILASRENTQHMLDLKKCKIEPIDLVVCDLYPFEEMVRKKKSHGSCLENIDIGGVTLLRAAAKNYNYVTVISNTGKYFELLKHLDENDGSTSHQFRLANAMEAFMCSSNYDWQVSKWFSNSGPNIFPEVSLIKSKLSKQLPYGENPHQKAALYKNENSRENGDSFIQHQGKNLSYNNFLDFDSCLGLLRNFRSYTKPLVGIIKHTNPCGVASGSSVLDSFNKALECDPISAFGGIVVSNSRISLEETEKIVENFFEMIIAPGFDDSALKVLSRKKKMRVVSIGDSWKSKTTNDYELRSTSLGLLLQEKDSNDIKTQDLKVVTNLNPKSNELEDLVFAWKVVKQLKSNGIVFVKNSATVGIGCGQSSRVDSVVTAITKSEIMKQKMGLSLSPLDGAVMASDAFFPFADSLDKAVSKGIKSVVQPGGSIRDNEVIDFANKNGVSMVLTGIRAFKH